MLICQDVTSFMPSSRERSLVNVDLTRANLRDADLQKASFVNTDLSGVDFGGANLKGVRFVNATLDGANFSGAIWIDGHRCGEKSVGSCR